MIGHTNWVYSLQLIFPDIIASGDKDGIIIIWNISNPTNTSAFILKRLTEHQSKINALQYIYSNLLASASNDYTIKIWDVSNYSCVKTLTGDKFGIGTLKLVNVTTAAQTSGHLIYFEYFLKLIFYILK